MRCLTVLIRGGGERHVSQPMWSPDGDWIAFSAVPLDGGYQETEIFVVRLDGTDLTKVTNNKVEDIEPRWLP